MVQAIRDQAAAEHGAVVQTSQVRAYRRGPPATPVVPDEQQRLVDSVAQQGAFLLFAQRRVGHLVGQCIGLEHHIAIGLRIVLPELGAKERTGQAVRTGQRAPARQAHVGPPQQTVENLAGKAALDRRRLQKMRVDAAVRVLAAQRFDQASVPAGVHQAKPFGIQEQRQFIEPAKEIMPITRMVRELIEGLLNQALVPRHVLAHVLLAAAGQCRRAPAQRIELMVAHDAARLVGLDHVMHDVQRLADERPAINDVAKKQRLARGMAPHAALLVITQPVEQTLQGVRTAVHIADQVVTSRRVKHQSPPVLPSRLPQPSLVRHTS
jgi:hypothetical protein